MKAYGRIWPHNLHSFFVKADIVHPTEENSYGGERKARVAAIKTGKNCLAENRKKAAAASSDAIEFVSVGNADSYYDALCDKQ
jgi:hypothetical protein